MTSEALTFACEGEPLVGILHQPGAVARRGILMVVGGGPQYRVGGHRQLTLWARRLCAEGYPVFRFDYRGMGDSHGNFVGFEGIDADIRCAIDEFQRLLPELTEIVLWGECDAASAILFYAYRDPRVTGLILQNPWVRTEQGAAKAILRYYYARRLLEPSFWHKVMRFRFNPFASAKSALDVALRSRGAGSSSRPTSTHHAKSAPLDSTLPLPDRLLTGITRFKGPVMLVLSGRDIVAREFSLLIEKSEDWQQQFRLKPVQRHDFEDSDHTFSSAADRDRVVTWALEWLKR